MKFNSPLLTLCLACQASVLLADASSSRLPRSRPEAQGVAPAALLEFVEALDGIDAMNSVMVVRHGHVITEGWWAPYDAASNHELYSLSKSFTSTAVGMAVAEARLSVDDEVLKFFPDDAPPEPSANLKSMRVRDLLSMSAGHQDETATDWDKISAKAFLAHPVPHKPGTHFKYNTPATFMLSAIVQKQTGQTVAEYLGPRLFEPLGIEHPVWNTNWQGISLGGYGLRVTTEDIACFGQLYLQKGTWRGKQLLPASWVEAATSRQTSNGSSPKSDWDQGYGYQFWRCRNGGYRGDGAFGQYCMVLPAQDAVIVITSGVKDMQAVMNVVWDKLLPAFQPRRISANATERTRLESRLANLTVKPAAGGRTAPVAGRILGRRFAFSSNDQNIEAITLRADSGGKGWILTTRIAGADVQLPCGYQEWRKSQGPFGRYPNEPLAATGGWISEDTFTAKICATETPYYATIKLRFDGDQVTRTIDQNVGFGRQNQAELVGHSEDSGTR